MGSSVFQHKNIIGVLILLAILMSACSGNTVSGQTEPTPESALEVTDEGIVVEGEVVPIRYVSLSFASNGIVEEILYEEGEAVAEGEVIARLQGSERLVANIASAELELVNAQQNLDDLYESHELDKANAHLALVIGEQSLEDYLETRQDKEAGRASQDAIDKATAEYYIAQAQVDDAQDAYYDVDSADDTNLSKNQALLDLSSARESRDRKLAAMNWYLGNPDALELATADADIEVADALLNKLEKDYQDLMQGPNPKKLEVAQARLLNAQAQVDAATKALSDIELAAPFTGVLAQNNLKKGELLTTGTSYVTLADLSLYKIETTDLTELDVVKVVVGDPVTVTLDAIPEVMFTGWVESVESLGENKQGDITYTAVIALDQQDERLKWKMTASVTLLK